MPIQLDKILADVAQERVLHPNCPDGTKQDIDDAWSRVGKKNSLTVHEVRSIYKVLQKKYEQEKSKERSTWKLFPLMDELHQANKLDAADEEQLPMEEDEEYEMLEVQEEDEQHQGASTASVTSGQTPSSGGEASDSGESPVKSMKTESSCGDSPGRFEKQITITTAATSTTTTNNNISNNNSLRTSPPRGEEKKLLNSLISPNSRLHSSTAAALQKKGITMKRATSSGKGHKIINNASSQQSRTASSNGGHQLLAIGKTIQLPEALKRKLSEDQASSTTTPLLKKPQLGQKNSKPDGLPQKGLVVKSASQLFENEIENQETSTNSKADHAGISDSESTATSSTFTTSHHGINLITIPANDVSGSLVINGSTHAVVPSDASNGISSPHIEDIDFRNDIIFDTNINNEQISVSSNGNGNGNSNGNGNGHLLPKVEKADTDKGEKSIDLGPVDNILPRTFFKNLCNSTRHESLGLYVANALNRMDARAAGRLELNILRAIIDAQKERSAES